MPRTGHSPTDRLALSWAKGGLAEAGAAAALAAEAFNPHFRETWTEAQMAGLLRGGNGWLNLGLASDRLVAFALSRQALDEVELLLCAVAVQWRGKGVANDLVAQVVRAALDRGARRIFLEVRSSNHSALALYKRCGFQVAGKRPGYYRTAAGESIDAITLSLPL